MPYLAELKGVHPTGWMVSSMNVFIYTVVARSFQGLPDNNEPNILLIKSDVSD